MILAPNCLSQALIKYYSIVEGSVTGWCGTEENVLVFRIELIEECLDTCNYTFTEIVEVMYMYDNDNDNDKFFLI